jgi:hypothetical protein
VCVKYLALLSKSGISVKQYCLPLSDAPISPCV